MMNAMRISRLTPHLLRVPLGNRSLPLAGHDPCVTRPEALAVLVARVETDDGPAGLGFSYAAVGGRALLALAADDIAPHLTGEDPLNHERIAAKVRHALREQADGPLFAAAYAAVDLALWDLKGQAAGLPLWRLLGGAKPVAPAFLTDPLGPGAGAGQTVKLTQPALKHGLMGVLLHLEGCPEHDAERVQQVREALGEDAWLGVAAEGRYDRGTALAMGHLFEEEIGADWFEQPLPDDDLDGLRRLAGRLELPLALGTGCRSLADVRRLLECGAVGVLRPDVVRLGGVTTWLKAAALAEGFGVPVAPVRLPEVGVHLACGLPGVQAAEQAPWLAGLFAGGPTVLKGKLAPPDRPGLGLELAADAIAKWEITPE
jgi:L-talarate/galactarate dehydratase